MPRRPRGYTLFPYTTLFRSMAMVETSALRVTALGPVVRATSVIRTCVIRLDRKSTRLNSSHANISYAVFCLKKKNQQHDQQNVEHKGRLHEPSGQLGYLAQP